MGYIDLDNANFTNYSATDIAALEDEARKEIACYGLPYGGIGFASHLLTYYCIGIMILGRRPVRFWKALESSTKDILLGIVTLIATVIVSSISIHRCQKHWEFSVLGIWMLTTSICLSAVTIVVPTSTGDTLNQRPKAKAFLIFVAIIWFIGSMAGIIAIVLVTKPRFDFENGPNHSGTKSMTIVTSVFFILCFVLPLRVGFVRLFKDGKLHVCSAIGLGVALIIPSVMVFGLLWMDWGLGIVTGNLAGVPSKGNAPLYWTYFAAKRLPFFAG